MAYTVLARRYRSGTFDEVIGQDHVAQTLKRAIEASRVAHAYLFTGTRGVGKTSMARILAKALNCLAFDAPTTTPCGKCSSCLAIAKGEDIDVIEIDAASSTGVDNIRDLISNAQFRPARSRFKVYIIDEVHMLSKGAFNALLKIMEEPPEHVKFILATTEVDKILPTILSRCQRYDFRNIPTREIVDHLRSITKEEGVKAEEDALALVARAGAGSMRDSLSLLDRLLSVGEKTLTADMIEKLLGMPKAAAIFAVANAIGTGDVKATLEHANAVIDGGLSADTLIASLVDHFHNLLVLSACGMDSKLVDLVGIDAKELDQQAKAFDPSALTANIAILEELRRQMRSSQAGRALLDATLARLALSAEFSTIGEMVARLNGAPAPARGLSAEKKKPELSVQVVGRSVAPERAPLTTVSAPSAPIPAAIRSDPGVDRPRAEVAPPSDRTASVVRKPVLAEVEAPNEEIREQGAHATDEVDELPAVGKVAAEGATRSLWQAFKKSTPAPTTAPSSSSSTSAVHEVVEPAQLAKLREYATEKLTGRHAAMFDHARLIAYDDSTGVAKLHFPHDAISQADYVKRNRPVFTLAFTEAAGRDVSLTLEVAAAPEVVEAPVEDRKPKVIRPNLDAVAAETPDTALAPAVDVDAVKDDPLVAAILKAFDGARIVKVE
jgi:DNA polymerase-3 subunit gamma/tau